MSVIFSSADNSAMPTLLASQIYGEGFGQGAYSRFDVRFYQTLNDVDPQQQTAARVCRATNTAISVSPMRWAAASASMPARSMWCAPTAPTRRRASLTVNWSRPFVGALGDLWKVTLHTDAAAYDASDFNQQPNFGPKSQIDAARAQPQAALDFRWPFMRDSGAWGTQLIEPIAQIVVGAAGRRQSADTISE